MQGNIAVDCTDTRPIGLFEGYLDDPVRTNASMLGNYYITGDRGYKDPDGYIWFDSRSDDVIISSGYAAVCNSITRAIEYFYRSYSFRFCSMLQL